MSEDDLHTDRDTAGKRCLVCDTRLDLLCDEDLVRDQLERAAAFHLRRLERHESAELSERAHFTHDEAVPLFVCPSCGLLTRGSPGEDADLGDGYANDSYPADRLPEMLASQVALFRRKIPVLRRLLRQHRRVVEVGSFVGGFLEMCRLVGWDAIGVDPGKQLAAWCRERGLRVHDGTLDEWSARADAVPVDCVAIWNTFDQLADPRRTLARAAEILEPGGMLVLRVPHGVFFRTLLPRLAASSRVGRRFWEACLAWNNLLSFPHLYGYGVASLDRLVTPFGFERVATQGDVLGILSGRATAAWARAEEQVVKRTQLAWIRAQSLQASSGLSAAPWLDVYWRRN